jgi:hypothetical protein
VRTPEKKSYIVKEDTRCQYVATVERPGSGGEWTIRGWTSCQRCAVVLTRDEAHEVAHAHGRPHHVIRLRKRAP